MKKNSNKKYLYLVIILTLVLIAIVSLSLNKKTPEEIQIEKINEQNGPLQIQDEYLGPNTNSPITF